MMTFASLKMSKISNDNYPESSIRVNLIKLVKNMCQKLKIKIILWIQKISLFVGSFKCHFCTDVIIMTIKHIIQIIFFYPHYCNTDLISS